MDTHQSQRGTTLVEAVVAIALLAGSVVLLAGLSHMAVRSVTMARERTLAAVFAVLKLEALCRDVRGLGTSPGDTLAQDTAGFVEYLDARGNVASAGPAPFVRRWSVSAMTSDATLLAITVDAAACRVAQGTGRCGDTATRVRLLGVRSRIAW